MSTASEITATPALACNLAAIEAEQHDQHLALAKDLFARVQAVTELPNGYAFRLPSDTDTFLQTAKFVENERKCCPFDFTLALSGADGPFWLKLTGQDGIKELLQNELGHYLNKSIKPDTGQNPTLCL